MGYYTRYELKVLEGGDQELIGTLISCCEEAAFAIDEHGSSIEPSKWYEHEKDLRAFSEKHPNTAFKLSGAGDEESDIWVEYYKGGKMQRCNSIIETPEFNPDHLA